MLTIIACVLTSLTTYLYCKQKHKTEFSKLKIQSNLLYQQGYEVGFADCKEMTLKAFKKL